MSLTHAIMTSLLEKPCTGAELARRFDKSLGYFWQATHQQIYRELGKMELSGLIAAHGMPTARGQQRQFAVLAAGRSELASWCAQEGALRPIKDALLVRMRAAAVLGATGGDTVDILTEMRRHMLLHGEVLARYEAIEAHDFPAGSPRSVADEMQLAVVRAGIAYENSWLAWCHQALAALEAG